MVSTHGSSAIGLCGDRRFATFSYRATSPLHPRQERLTAFRQSDSQWCRASELRSSLTAQSYRRSCRFPPPKVPVVGDHCTRHRRKPDDDETRQDHHRPTRRGSSIGRTRSVGILRVSRREAIVSLMVRPARASTTEHGRRVRATPLYARCARTVAGGPTGRSRAPLRRDCARDT
jgi:hypothetical protein